MAAPGAVVARCVGIAGGGLLALAVAPVAPSATPCEIKPLSRAASVADQTAPMTRSDPPGKAAGARTVRVPEDRAGQRLDNFLLGQLKGAPRSLVYKLVRSGQVRVNGCRDRA